VVKFVVDKFDIVVRILSSGQHSAADTFPSRKIRTMSNAVACKNHLLDLINNANNASELMAVADTITMILTHTEGLWLEADYCYKASEIAQRLVMELASYEVEGLHHATEKKLRTHRLILAKLADRYHKLQHQTAPLAA
jgi:hypothetical protein